MNRLLLKVGVALAILVFCLIFIPDPVGLKPIISAIVIVAIILVVVFTKLIKKDADYQKNLILAVGFGLTIISWFITGYMNNVQSVNESKRSLKVKLLLDAYIRLENSDHRDIDRKGLQHNKYDYVYLNYAESAVNSIQLMGDEKLIALTNKFTMSGGKENFNELLIELRNELRKELNLSKLPDSSQYSPTVYRMYRNEKMDTLTDEQRLNLIIRLSEYDKELLK
ncbi:hypothetical protein [Mucilaginibacter panaciglaebae]|uniref:Uncharacterized protein n=1 Tax=Mucilaginibacter panaciglaebae TaxID=502331 RepID=A0ABP7WNM4_9SPHI